MLGAPPGPFSMGIPHFFPGRRLEQQMIAVLERGLDRGDDALLSRPQQRVGEGERDAGAGMTARLLEEIEELGLQLLYSDIDITGNVVEIYVVVLDEAVMVSADPRFRTWGDLRRRGAQQLRDDPGLLLRESSPITPGTPAAIIYPSEESDRLKGVVLASYMAGATMTSNSWGASVGGAYDSSSQAYDALTKACNSCHQATNFGFNVVTRPTGNTFLHQNFAPPPKEN